LKKKPVAKKQPKRKVTSKPKRSKPITIVGTTYIPSECQISTPVKGTKKTFKTQVVKRKQGK